MSLVVPFSIAILALSLAAVASIVWRRALVMALPVLAILNGLSIAIGTSSVRVDQLVASALIVPLVAPILMGRRRLRTDRTTWLLAALIVANLAASLLHSPARSYSLLQCINLGTVWIIYLLLLNFLDTREALDTFFRRMLWAGIIACAVAVVAYAAAVAGLPVGGAEVSTIAAQRLTRAYGAYGTMLEPNILGSFAGAQLVLAIGILVTAARTAEAGSELHARLARWLGVVAVVALALSFTRAAWLGAIAGLLTFVALGGPILGVRIRARRILWPAAVGCVVIVILLLLPGNAGELFRFKLINLVNLGSQTGVLRLVTYTMALEQTADHPLIGWGTFTFAPLVSEGGDFQQFDNWRNLWVGNFLLLALHDTGVVGLLLWIVLVATALTRGIRAVRVLSGLDPHAAGRTLALVAAVVSLLIPFLATTGFSLAYPWLFIGLLGAQARLVESGAFAIQAAVPPATDHDRPPPSSPPQADATR